MIDGCTVYRYIGGCRAEKCIPYVPLYGKQWSIGYMPGMVNQPFNMLTPKVKISYLVDNSSVLTVTVGVKIKSIDAIWADGKPLSPSVYRIHSDNDKIELDNCYVKGEMTAYVTLDTEAYRNADFESCDIVSVYDAFEDSRVFIYGGEDGGRSYVSLPAPEEDLAQERSVYGHVAPIYFPNSTPARFSGVGKITDMSRIYDRMLIFSEHRAWMTSSLRSEEGRSAMIPIFNTAAETVGCSSEYASDIINGDNPITVSHGGVIKWSVDGEFKEEMRLASISDKINGIFDSDFVRNAAVCYNRGENELWFAHVGSENGLVVVYNCASGAWYTFDGIPAERFYKIGENVAFRSGNSFYIFDTDDGYDCREDGERDIEAVIESAGFDFSCPAEKKHIGRSLVTCDTGDGLMELELSDGNRLVSAVLDKSLASKFHDGVDFFDLDMRTGRSERMRFTLTATGRSRQRIYKLEFFAD